MFQQSPQALTAHEIAQLRNRLVVGRDARRVRRTRAVSLKTLLESSQRVDLIDADIQGVEAEVFEPAATLLAAKVRRTHIGTHDRDNEPHFKSFAAHRRDTQRVNSQFSQSKTINQNLSRIHLLHIYFVKLNER